MYQPFWATQRLSAFDLAVSYADKCVAVKAKTSVAAGWSSKAVNVVIPQGYGCDTAVGTGSKLPLNKPPPINQISKTISADAATIPHADIQIRPGELMAYQRVSSLISNQHDSGSLIPSQPTPALPPTPMPAQHHLTTHASRTHLSTPPLPAYSWITYPTVYNSPHRPPAHVTPTPVQRRPYSGYHHHYLPYQAPAPIPSYGPPVHFPAPIQANNSSLYNGLMPNPTKNDLVAGTNYFNTRIGNQDSQ